MRLLYTVAAILLATAYPATAVPASIGGVVEGLTQGKSGVTDLGKKCHNDNECMNSLYCFGKTTIHRGRCVYHVARRDEECSVTGPTLSAQNRCSFGLTCVDGKCKRGQGEGYQFGSPGLAEPCLNPLRSGKERPWDFTLQPREGIPCQQGLECRTSKDQPDGLGACFPK